MWEVGIRTPPNSKVWEIKIQLTYSVFRIIIEYWTNKNMIQPKLQLWASPESYRKTHIWKTKIGDIISEKDFYLETAVACHYLGYQTFF